MKPTQETSDTTGCDSKRELWCLLEGKNRPFLIRISPTSYIYDLEELVLTKCTVDGLDPKARDTIVLMKIDVDYLANRNEISSHLFEPNLHGEGVKVLDNTMEEIAKVWPTAPRKGSISVFIYKWGTPYID